jgi:putative ABC transport system permease protein
VIGEMFARLRSTPSMRAITLDATGAARFDEAWFASVRTWPETGFVLPSTRFAAGQADFSPAAGGTGAEERASLVPTGLGDPVFAPDSPALQGPFEAKFSNELAARLGVGRGQRVRVAVERRVAGRQLEPLVFELAVTDVAPPQGYAGRAAFVDAELLVALEDFRDGFTAPILGVESGRARPPRGGYPNFRLYARSLEDVAPLVARLRDGFGLSVGSHGAEIAAALNLDANLRAIMRALVVLGALGLAGGLAAIQWSMAARKRRTIAVFSLMGFGRWWLVGFPVAQAALLGGVGAALTIGAAFLFGAWINAHLAASLGAGGRACVLTVPLLANGTALLLLVSVLPALRIGSRYAALEPANEIRES